VKEKVAAAEELAAAAPLVVGSIYMWVWRKRSRSSLSAQDKKETTS
jgi:hypothetical protein